MTADDESLPPHDEAMAARLTAESPQPSPALRRRVRDSVQKAFGRRALRRRSAAMVAGGAALLAVAAALAFTVPS